MSEENRDHQPGANLPISTSGEEKQDVPPATSKPEAPYRRTGFFLLILCALPLPFLSSFATAETAVRAASVLADVGLLLFGLFFGIGEWKARRVKMALLVLIFMVMAVVGFILHCQILFS